MRSPLPNRLRLLLLVGLLSAAHGCAPAVDDGSYDLVIRGASVIDGLGTDRYRADLGIRGDRIVAVRPGGIAPQGNARVIEADGRVVAPGFIDLHAHLDPILRLPEAESMARQGVTTALGGPDGGGPWPFREYLAQVESTTVGINVGFMAGHNSIRRSVMNLENRAPTPKELDRMQAMVAASMAAGAFGISTGLKYLPGAFSDVDEVVALSQVAADSGGFYTSHLREEGLELIDGVSEALEIGRRARIPVVLTHHKVVGAPSWGASQTTLAMVDSARAAGTDAMIDQYPYTASYTGITVLIPAWAMEGGDEAFLARVDNPATHDSIMAGIVFNIINARGANDLSRVQFALVEWDRSLEGQTLADWADRKGLPHTPGVGAQLVVEAVRNGGASAIYHAMDPGDVARIMTHPQTMIASDGRLTQPGEGHPHPRWYGTFPRVLGHYVRDEGLMSLETAVHKMTGLPAARMGLEARGRIAEGAYADLVVFDPETIQDRATFEAPHQYPVGIDWVVVNGVVTVEGDSFTDARAGRVLRANRTAN